MRLRKAALQWSPLVTDAIIGDGDRSLSPIMAPATRDFYLNNRVFLSRDYRSLSVTRNKKINRKPSSGKSYEILML